MTHREIISSKAFPSHEHQSWALVPCNSTYLFDDIQPYAQERKISKKELRRAEPFDAENIFSQRSNHQKMNFSDNESNHGVFDYKLSTKV